MIDQKLIDHVAAGIYRYRLAQMVADGVDVAAVDFDALPEGVRASWRPTATAALASLECTYMVVELPKPEHQGSVGTWELTADELDLLDLKPGDQLGSGIVGPPVERSAPPRMVNADNLIERLTTELDRVTAEVDYFTLRHPGGPTVASWNGTRNGILTAIKYLKEATDAKGGY